MNPKAERWTKLADYRFRSATVLMESGQNLDAVFHLQQSLEYVLKALLASQLIEPIPRSHDLLELASLVKPSITGEHALLLADLHDVSVPLRYPDDLAEALEAYSYERVLALHQRTKGFMEWSKTKMN